MNEQQAKRLRIYLTLAVTIFEIAHLAWEHFHGGILSHHLLNRADLPSVSNAWGIVLLPVLSWVLSGLALRRVTTSATSAATGNGGARVDTAALPRSLLLGFFVAFAFSLTLALSFTFGVKSVSSLMFQAMLLLALVFRVYRGECLLGFVLGMSFTFGAVLPTLIGGMIALLSLVAHRVLYPLVSRVWLWLGQR